MVNLQQQQRIGPYYLLLVFLLSILSFILNTTKNLPTISTIVASKTKSFTTIVTATATAPPPNVQDLQVETSSSGFQSRTVSLPTVSESSSSTSSYGKVEKEMGGWWSKYVPHISRVYTPWNGTTRYGWCVSSQVVPIPNATDFPRSKGPITGLIYVKSHKASSSTSQGITANIAHHVGQQMFRPPLSVLEDSTTSTSSSSSEAISTTGGGKEEEEEVVVPCTYYSHHKFAGHKGHGRLRQHNTSLLWTVVRHPASRDISQFMHFHVGRKGIVPTETNLIPTLKIEFQSRQVKYLLPTKRLEKKVTSTMVQNQPDTISNMIQKYILNYYDFIGITERMNESLAVMTLLWDLDITDVIVLSSKQSGGYDGGANQQCTKIPKATTTNVRTKVVEEFLQSNEYQSSHADFLLYHAAVASLDRTIDELGYELVQDRTKQIQELQQLAELKCSKIAKFPCSPSGERQTHLSKHSCYTIDAGCGHACVDRVLRPNRTMIPSHSSIKKKHK